MSEGLFEKSIKITTSLMKQIGETTLQSACDKLSSPYGEDTIRSAITTESGAPSQNARSLPEENGGGPAEVQAIYDVNYALKMAWDTSIYLLLVSSICVFFVWHKVSVQYPEWAYEFSIAITLMLLVAFVISFVRVWQANQPSVIFVFGQSGQVSFCAQDIELSVFDFLLFRRFRNAWRRRVVSFSEIYRVDNEIFQAGGKRRRKYFSINVSGRFGSQKIVFSNKQKRDECRALFSVGIKRYAKDARMDSNLSVGSSGDSGY